MEASAGIHVFGTPESKVLTAEEMQEERSMLKREGLRCVLALGCFDVLHMGHIDFLQFAREQGDCLIVGVASDAAVRRSKGRTRPIVAERDRALLVASLSMVDYAVVNYFVPPVLLAERLKPEVFVKGYDWRSCQCAQKILSINADVTVTAPCIRSMSTTQLVESILHAERQDHALV
jgi:D-beta-D-heptose 7-phosphate kinase/D-beta-D-heptose 1-phosphate adenosyltransferase